VHGRPPSCRPATAESREPSPDEVEGAVNAAGTEDGPTSGGDGSKPFRSNPISRIATSEIRSLAFSAFGLTLGADVFNAFNESYVLQRQGVLGRNNSDHVLEILSPRVYRLGARLSFN
jgi:hypothetical protein